MIEVGTSVEIDRPLDEVFAYIVDQSNDPHWQTGVISAEQESSGPLKVGDKIRETRKFLGRRIEREEEVVEIVPNARLKFRSTGQTDLETTYELEATPGGTKVAFRMHMQERGPLRIAHAGIERMIKREVETNFAHLKDILEAQDHIQEAWSDVPHHHGD